jgi:hypothetical protein
MTQASDPVFSASPVPSSMPARPKRANGNEDLSRQIEAAVEKQRGDVVRCSRVSGHHYRCNWWAEDLRPTLGDGPRGAVRTVGSNSAGGGSALINSHRIRQSKFLYVTVRGDRMVIEDATAGQR